jgi:uncharacterized membrane protein
MLRIPLARPIYSATNQISDALPGGQRTAFRRVGLVQWPRAGASTVGFVTGEHERLDGSRLRSVFIASAVPGRPSAG